MKIFFARKEIGCVGVKYLRRRGERGWWWNLVLYDVRFIRSLIDGSKKPQIYC
jgi:hypothetical protein